jgi:hypothetical protein
MTALTPMDARLRAAFDGEIARAAEARRNGDASQAFRHLERAHILGQRFTAAHVRVHWLMLRHGVAMRQPREVVGQLVRIVAAALFSRIWVPAGNTGGANVGAMRPMPIPEDLREWLEPPPARDGRER